MRHERDLEILLQWRRDRAETDAPRAPSAAHLLKLVEPWWEKWPERFAAAARRLGAMQLSYGYAMSHPHQGHSGHPVAALITNGDGEHEAPARILYVSVRDGRLRLRFHLAPVPRSDRQFEVTFVSEAALRPILSAQADLSGEGEYRVDVELPGELASAWESLKVTDPMPFRFILRASPDTN
ncbi:MAG TPA: hypothetical protein VJS39_11475 [Gemmatimonadaceae bacterium]|nr:hypothetical protein [Gemmatimonadaceae bacterium]